MISTDWHMTIIVMLAGISITLIGLVWRNLTIQVNKKVDKANYDETIKHITKAVDGINGTAKTLKDLARDISVIQNKFITRQEHDYELRLHRSECPVVRELARRMDRSTNEVSAKDDNGKTKV